MRVFVTGASGHIGKPTVSELLKAGHEVVGLARSDASAKAVQKLGADVLRGDIQDTALLKKASSESDGVIHLAFRHDIAFSGDFPGAIASDRAAIEAMCDALEGSNKPFVGTGGTLFLAYTVKGRDGTEDDRGPSGGPNPRIDIENLVIGRAKTGVRTSTVRLAPTVHSSLDLHGFVPMLIQLARKSGFAAYVGDGANRWPAVHTLDAATLYVKALASAPAGSILHGNADTGVPFKQIAEAIGRGAGVPAKSIEASEAEKHFSGFLGHVVQLDNPTSSAKTQKLLGWKPTHAGLLDDLAEKHYFVQSVMPPL